MLKFLVDNTIGLKRVEFTPSQFALGVARLLEPNLTRHHKEYLSYRENTETYLLFVESMYGIYRNKFGENIKISELSDIQNTTAKAIAEFIYLGVESRCTLGLVMEQIQNMEIA